MTHRVFTLPDLGEGLTEAELVRWLVDVGDTIAVDSPVAEVETAKAVVEVPSPFGGIVADLHGTRGTTVQVGEPLISIAPDRPTESSTYIEEERAGSGNILIGYGTDAGKHGRRRRRANRVAASSAVPTKDTNPPQRPRAQSPIVRKLARERRLDLSAVTGTGPDGLITRKDVERAAAPPAAPATTGQDERTGLAISERVALTGIRKAIADTLRRSRQEIPEATTWVDVDATALLDYRASLRTAEHRGPGLLALMARFVVAGLARFPALNARIDADSEQILHFDGVNLGIATQTERGLLVPTVRNAHLMSARRLDTEIRGLTDAARRGSATAAELSSGSFTLNNYGAFGVDGSAAIINYPEVAILGMGRVIERPWVADGQLVVRSITQLSLVFDHRVCDGATAAGFLRFVAEGFEAPLSVLADL